MNGPITLGAASLMGSLGGLAGLSRWWVRPTRPVRAAGRHRAPAPVAAPLVAPVAGPEPVEALVIEVVQCPVCCRETRHVRFAVLKGLMCLDCRHREA